MIEYSYMDDCGIYNGSCVGISELSDIMTMSALECPSDTDGTDIDDYLRLPIELQGFVYTYDHILDPTDAGELPASKIPELSCDTSTQIDVAPGDDASQTLGHVIDGFSIYKGKNTVRKATKVQDIDAETGAIVADNVYGPWVDIDDVVVCFGDMDVMEPAILEPAILEPTISTWQLDSPADIPAMNAPSLSYIDTINTDDIINALADSILSNVAPLQAFNLEYANQIRSFFDVAWPKVFRPMLDRLRDGALDKIVYGNHLLKDMYALKHDISSAEIENIQKATEAAQRGNICPNFKISLNDEESASPLVKEDPTSTSKKIPRYTISAGIVHVNGVPVSLNGLSDITPPFILYIAMDKSSENNVKLVTKSIEEGEQSLPEDAVVILGGVGAETFKQRSYNSTKEAYVEDTYTLYSVYQYTCSPSVTYIPLTDVGIVAFNADGSTFPFTTYPTATCDEDE